MDSASDRANRASWQQFSLMTVLIMFGIGIMTNLVTITLIAFAGPRVVKDTTGKDLPEGFQRSEFLLEKGFLDFITHRKNLKDNINLYIDLILNQPIRK